MLTDAGGEASPPEQPLRKVESKMFITTNWEVLWFVWLVVCFLLLLFSWGVVWFCNLNVDVLV